MQNRQPLNDAQREALVAQMKDREDQWILLIPRTAGTFCGKRITLSLVKFYPVDDGYEHTPLSSAENALLRLILARLPAIVALIEERFASEITPKEPTFILHASEPMIWISRVEQQEKGNDWWTFCVGRDDDPETHWYFDFRGLQLIDVYCVR